MKNIKNLKIAIVHDFLVQKGGAEKVLEAICEDFPDAPIYTLIYDKEKMGDMFVSREIRPSYLQNFPKFLRKRYKWLLPFLIVVPETFDLRDFDLIISSSGAWSKGIVTKLNTIHVAYIHSPMRFIWDYNERYLKEKKVRNSILKRLIFSYLRIWDRLAADRPDYLVANSKYTQNRIAKYYRRESDLIYPPVANESGIMNQESKEEMTETKKLMKLKAKSYFMVVSRLSGYKKTDIVVEAFNKLELPLVVIGEGEQKKHLKKIAKNNVQILGWKDDKDLADYYKNARALIFAAEDDFGIVPVEAMSFGVPVIALRKGGVLETVVEGVSGEFFDAQTPEVLADGIRRFMENEKKYDRDKIKKQAERFSKERFKKELGEYINHVTYNM